MDVQYTRTAQKTLRRMPKNKAEAVLKGMKTVAKDPFALDNMITPLKGVENGFRRRFGDWRVLYTVDSHIEILEVFKIGTRGDVYR